MASFGRGEESINQDEAAVQYTLLHIVTSWCGGSSKSAHTVGVILCRGLGCGLLLCRMSLWISSSRSCGIGEC